MDLFETTCVIGESTMKEIKKQLMPPKQRAVFIVFTIIFACLSIYSFFIQFYSLTIVCIVAEIVFLVEYKLILNNYIKINLKRILETTNAEQYDCTSSFCDDGVKIINHSTNASGTIHYDNICRFTEAKSIYALFTKANQFVFVNKNVIDAEHQREAFISFLKSHCKNVKWKQ